MNAFCSHTDQDLFRKCSECGKLNCQTCSRLCRCTCHWMCEKCLLQCPNCHARVCKDSIKTTFDGVKGCFFCLKTCSVESCQEKTTEKYCPNHSKTCELCSKPFGVEIHTCKKCHKQCCEECLHLVEVTLDGQLEGSLFFCKSHKFKLRPIFYDSNPKKT
jgi:hypothetical protein